MADHSSRTIVIRYSRVNGEIWVATPTGRTFSDADIVSWQLPKTPFLDREVGGSSIRDADHTANDIRPVQKHHNVRMPVYSLVCLANLPQNRPTDEGSASTNS